MSHQQTDFLETADRIGARICRDAIWAGRACNWVGWAQGVVDGPIAPLYRAMGPDVYGGTAGIALFLARLHRFTGDPIQKATWEGALNQALGRLETMPEETRLGFYTGATGVAHVLIETGRIQNDGRLIERGLRELTRVCEIGPRPEAIAVMEGSAGAIPILLDATERFDRDDLAETAIRHGELLLDCAIKTNEGWSWKTVKRPLPKNLTGFSHGVAGIATALAGLFAATGDSRFRDGALAGLRYERTHFCREQGNWPDFQQIDNFPATDKPICRMAWCHGAPGIGLSRLRVWELLERDGKVRDEIEIAIATTEAWFEEAQLRADNDYSLCHGVSGNAELFMMGAEVLERLELRVIAEEVGQRGMEQFERNNLPWPCGVAEAGETANLMLGLAGIGYFYLRLHAPNEVPSILLIR
ncbi:MAG: hypothetical protein ISR77_33145 [Pirellulaceae bacterium]|nr:hypothetical protein [Pirellulaceae bacterium]